MVLSASKELPATQTPLLHAIEAVLAKHQAKGNGRTLTVNASTISADLALALARHQGWLEFSGLTELSDDAAAALASHSGRLDLSRLTALSDTAAEALWPHDGPLWLNGLRTLSDAAARSLAKHRVPLYLEGIETLSLAAAGSLAKHSGLILVKRLQSLPDTPGHVAFAKKITQDNGTSLKAARQQVSRLDRLPAYRRGITERPPPRDDRQDAPDRRPRRRSDRGRYPEAGIRPAGIRGVSHCESGDGRRRSQACMDC
jgi:hypothetical protein